MTTVFYPLMRWHRSQVELCGLVLTQCVALRALSLEFTGLTVEACQALGPHLAAHEAMVELSVAHNSVGPGLVDAVREVRSHRSSELGGAVLMLTAPPVPSAHRVSNCVRRCKQWTCEGTTPVPQPRGIASMRHRVRGTSD